LACSTSTFGIAHSFGFAGPRWRPVPTVAPAPKAPFGDSRRRPLDRRFLPVPGGWLWRRRPSTLQRGRRRRADGGAVGAAAAVDGGEGRDGRPGGRGVRRLPVRHLRRHGRGHRHQRRAELRAGGGRGEVGGDGGDVGGAGLPRLQGGDARHRGDPVAARGQLPRRADQRPGGGDGGVRPAGRQLPPLRGTGGGRVLLAGAAGRADGHAGLRDLRERRARPLPAGGRGRADAGPLHLRLHAGLLRRRHAHPHAGGQQADRGDQARRPGPGARRARPRRPRRAARGGGDVRQPGAHPPPARRRPGHPHHGRAPLLGGGRRLGARRFTRAGRPAMLARQALGRRGGGVRHRRVRHRLQPARRRLPHLFRGRVRWGCSRPRRPATASTA
jgi:hypothetical protein